LKGSGITVGRFGGEETDKGGVYVVMTGAG